MRLALKVGLTVVLLLLSGCEIVQTVAVAVAPDREDAPDVPTVVHESPDSIMIWYEKFIGEQKHDEARAMVEAHCGDQPFVTELKELADSFTMTGTCLQDLSLIRGGLQLLVLSPTVQAASNHQDRRQFTLRFWQPLMQQLLSGESDQGDAYSAAALADHSDAAGAFRW